MSKRYVFKKVTSKNNNTLGTWQEVVPSSLHIFKALVTCPFCGMTHTLRKHSIQKYGEVEPSLVCPTTGCNFHEFIKLEDWNFGGVT